MVEHPVDRAAADAAELGDFLMVMANTPRIWLSEAARIGRGVASVSIPLSL
jgi:hypothetical protein